MAFDVVIIVGKAAWVKNAGRALYIARSILIRVERTTILLYESNIYIYSEIEMRLPEASKTAELMLYANIEQHNKEPTSGHRCYLAR